MGKENKPTQEEIKKFWEWCGLERRELPLDKVMSPFPYSPWFDNKGKLVSYREVLPVDLNNLFKYALPKIGYGELKFSSNWKMKSVMIKKRLDTEPFYAQSDDAALALFWAIWQVIEK